MKMLEFYTRKSNRHNWFSAGRAYNRQSVIRMCYLAQRDYKGNQFAFKVYPQHIGDINKTYSLAKNDQTITPIQVNITSHPEIEAVYNDPENVPPHLVSVLKQIGFYEWLTYKEYTEGVWND